MLKELQQTITPVYLSDTHHPTPFGCDLHDIAGAPFELHSVRVTRHTVTINANKDCCSGYAWRAGMEKALGDYSFSGLSSSRGEEGSLAEQAAQSAAASTFEVT